MKKLPNIITLSSATALAGAAALFTTPLTHAQQGNQGTEDIEEVVVTGSRAAPRTAMDSAAPVDVLDGTDFQDQGTTDMNDLMRNLIPSFNVEVQDINDSNSLVRPATLRGLPADHTLILVNGKRRHRSSAIQFGNAGTHFPDTAQIPPIALQTVEVLRDGASAQYGSDAIAGVMNFRLRENDSGGTFDSKGGYLTETEDGYQQYYAGNVGLPLGDDGFVSLSADFKKQQKSDRGIQRGDAQALRDQGNTHVKSSNVMDQGVPDIDAINTFYNAGINLSADQRLYSFGGYSEKDTELGFFFRNPESRGGIFTTSNDQGEPIQLFFDTTEDMSANCPEIPTGVNPQTGVTSSIEARQFGLQSEDCFTYLERHPGGYIPDFGGENVDFHSVVGLEGEFTDGLFDGTSYDFSLGGGFNEMTYYLTNTVNASLGPQSPSRFEPGIYTTIENNVNADFVTPVDIGFASPLNVAYGVQWRREIFKVNSEDHDSWQIGPYSEQGANIGSDGFQGFGPQQQGSWDQPSWAFYLDLETDVTDRLLLGTALRYEDYYNTFGTTTDGKLSARFRLTDTTNLRGTVQTGFRAPTPGMANLTNISTGVEDGVPIADGQIPPTTPLAQEFGGEQLQPEESTGFSMGVATELGPIDLTVDYYNIEMEDRIVNSGFFEITAEEAEQLQEQGISGAGSVRRFQFWTNNLETTNEGVEIVADYSRQWMDFGTTDFQASWAWKDQTMDQFNEDVFDRGAQLDLTDRIPENRGNFRADHRYQDWRFTMQANYYDEYLRVPAEDDPSRDYYHDAEVIFSGEIAYTLMNQYTFIIGADNIFNTFPEEVREQDRTDFTSNKYVTDTSFTPNGRFAYARFRYDF